jgi:hypothetical protein
MNPYAAKAACGFFVYKRLQLVEASQNRSDQWRFNGVEILPLLTITGLDICGLVTLLFLMTGAFAAVYYVFFSSVPSVAQIRKMAKKYLKKYPKTKEKELRNALREHLAPETPLRGGEDEYPGPLQMFALRFILIPYLIIKLGFAISRGLTYLKYARQSKLIESRILDALDEIYGDE